MTDKDIGLTISIWRDEGMAQGTVVRLHDNMTPTEEIRQARLILSDVEILQAPSRAIAWYRHMQLVVQEFNKLQGKKIKLINTFGIFGEDEEVPVHILPLPYHMGLIYLSDADAN